MNSKLGFCALWSRVIKFNKEVEELSLTLIFDIPLYDIPFVVVNMKAPKKLFQLAWSASLKVKWIVWWNSHFQRTTARKP